MIVNITVGTLGDERILFPYLLCTSVLFTVEHEVQEISKLNSGTLCRNAVRRFELCGKILVASARTVRF